MAYAGIDKKRFAQLLEWGTDDDELRRFFADSRIQLIQKGAKVQNLPRGKPARIRALTQGLPSSTDRLLQKWCSENLTMLDPEPAADLVVALRMYEDAGESPPEDMAKRLARSCLVHLFAIDPAPVLMSFLKPLRAGSAVDSPEVKDVSALIANEHIAEALPAALGKALVALAEGRDPDEHLGSLSLSTASFVAGLHAVRSGRDDEVKVALEALDSQPAVRALLAEYADRSAVARARTNNSPRGLQMLLLSDPDESVSFDLDRDEVIAICTKDFPENAVFVHPFAIRTGSGIFVSLARDTDRERLFESSGDLIAFSGGRDVPRQPKRGEIGIWSAAKNRNSGPAYRTNFHIASEKTPVFEVRNVPFSSTEYDSVREYIKHQVEVGDAALVKTSLFILRDELIVGCPAGKDLTRDEGFETGLPCWRVLSAFHFEGRRLVPGPLPPSEVYECEALGSSLRKLFEKAGVDKPTRAQVRKLQELLASGEPQLNAARAARLRVELGAIEEHEGAMAVLLEEVMRDPQISSRIDEQVCLKVEALVSKKEQIRKNIEQLERQHSDLLEKRRQEEKEQKAIAPLVAKAIRSAFDKARSDAVGTLGQVAVFKALIDELIERPAASAAFNKSSVPERTVAIGSAITVRSAGGSSVPIIETLSSLGVTPKCARAIEAVGRLAHECGLILIVEGLAARIAAESWSAGEAATVKVLECGIGCTDDGVVKAVVGDAPGVIVVLDANLSPLDVYARSLIDVVQRRLSGTSAAVITTKFLMSVSDGMASLPLPEVVESISLRVSLDLMPTFLQEEDVAARLDEIATSDDHAGWFVKIWKPARMRVLNHLRAMPLEEVAFALSGLETARAAQLP